MKKTFLIIALFGALVVAGCDNQNVETEDVSNDTIADTNETALIDEAGESEVVSDEIDTSTPEDNASDETENNEEVDGMGGVPQGLERVAMGEPLEVYQHSKYSIGHPYGLDFTEVFDDHNDVVTFKTALDEAIMEVRVMQGNRVGFLDAAPLADEYDIDGEGPWVTGANETGYCDGPGCGDPFVSYGYYNEAQDQTYNVIFFNVTTPMEATETIMTSFEFK